MYLDVRIAEHQMQCREHRALLNGCEVAFAIAANEEEGWIDFLVPAHPVRSRSKVILDTRENSPYPFVVARAYGHVELITHSGAGAEDV